MDPRLQATLHGWLLTNPSWHKRKATLTRRGKETAERITKSFSREQRSPNPTRDEGTNAAEIKKILKLRVSLKKWFAASYLSLLFIKSTTFSRGPALLILKFIEAFEKEAFLLDPVDGNTFLGKMMQEKSVELHSIVTPTLVLVQASRHLLTFFSMVLPIRAELLYLYALFFFIFGWQVGGGGGGGDGGEQLRSSELTVNEQQNPDCGQILKVSASRAMAKSRRPGDIFPTLNHLLEPSLYRQIRSP